MNTLDYNKLYTKEELLELEPEEIYQLVLYSKNRMRFPNGYWKVQESEENFMRVVRWLIEDKLHWTAEDIRRNVTHKFFREYKLAGGLKLLAKDSPYYIINKLYPNKFKPWEMKHIPLKVWDKKECIRAIRWLFEEKLKYTKADVVNNITARMFKEYGLDGAFDYFGKSPYKVVNALYPNEFKPWELKRTPRDFWNDETIKEATKWMIEDKLQWSLEEVKRNLTCETFKEYGLNGMLCTKGNSIYVIVNLVYPNVFAHGIFKSRI